MTESTLQHAIKFCIKPRMKKINFRLIKINAEMELHNMQAPFARIRSALDQP